jgi:nitrous oxide reductase accessory protein NosL
MTPLLRAALATGALALGLMSASCKRTEDRCSYCGMKVKPDSAWRVVDKTNQRSFDTPRCAFGAKLEGKEKVGALELVDYYDREARPSVDLVYVAGSDVIGPMGPDLVPVKPAMVDKFTKDHGKKAVYREAEITPAVLKSLLE